MGFGVSGYPTIKVFRNGEKTADYQGGREANDFVKFLASQAGPSSVQIDDAAKFDAKLASISNIVMGFFADDKADGFSAFKKVADEHREDYKFAHTFNADVMKAAGKEAGTITIFRPKVMKSKFEEQVVDYDKEKFTVGLVRTWLKENIAGLAPVVKPADQDAVGYPQILCAYNVDYVRDPKGTQYWRNRVMKVAQKFSGNNIKFGVGNADEWAGMLQQAGITADGKNPACVAFDDRATKYPMKETFTMDTFEAFINDYDNGKLEAHVKSEEGVDNTGKANLVLTAKNYKSHVDGTKDAFIKFYAPWCGHCKTLAPKWEEMAEEFKNDDSMVIAHYNVDSNDLPGGFEVKGFPTMFWVPAGGSPKKYEGGRETKDLIDYVKKNHKAKDEL